MRGWLGCKLTARQIGYVGPEEVPCLRLLRRVFSRPFLTSRPPFAVLLAVLLAVLNATAAKSVPTVCHYPAVVASSVMPREHGALLTLEIGNNLGTKLEGGGSILGFDSHKGSRIIKQLAEACGSRTHHSAGERSNLRL